MFVKKASLHNFADDNTLSEFATELSCKFLRINDKKQLKLIQMIVNPKKFQVPGNLKLQINNTEITPQPSVELLGIWNYNTNRNNM